ncbi:hypothetical protein I6M49_02120 [Shewanella algae]|nr:hypothetical protein [Shewanella algae]
MEQVWQWLRQHCLSNRVFDCTSKLLTKYPEPGIPSLRDTGRVKSLCSRDWINLTR